MTTKKLAIILIGVVFIAFGVGFFALNFLGNKTGENIFSTNNFSINLNSTGSVVDIDESAVEDINKVEKIYITAPIARINIISEDREDVSVHYHGQVPSSIKTSLETKKSNDKLEINVKAKNHSKININNNMQLYLDILIPNFYSKNMKIEANLGDIRIQDLKLAELDIDADLGNVNIKNIETDELDINCAMGNVICNDIEGNANVSADLGNIELYYDFFDYDLNAESNLGSITITLPKDANFNLDANANLGKINTDFPVTTNESSNTKLKGTTGNGGKDVKLTVDLGSIKIKSK